MNPILNQLGRGLARFLSRPDPRYQPLATTHPQNLAEALAPGDVLLVEGNTRFSKAIKFLSQSTWSHAALCVAAPLQRPDDCLIEADVVAGVAAVPLKKYASMHTRICRPVGLCAADIETVVSFAQERIGLRYDLKNTFDLMRYLLPHPPVPVRWRRRMLTLGSSDPTRAICSTLIAQAFQSIHYPILPEITQLPASGDVGNACYEEILHIRNYSLFVPRDFDISPYFEIVKPELTPNFDYRRLHWGEKAPS